MHMYDLGLILEESRTHRLLDSHLQECVEVELSERNRIGRISWLRELPEYHPLRVHAGPALHRLLMGIDIWRLRRKVFPTCVLAGFDFTVLVPIANAVALFGVILLRGLAPGLTLASLRGLGVRPVTSVLFEQRTASYGSWWIREVQKTTKEPRHQYRPLAEKAMEGVLSLLKAGCWEFKRLT